MKIIALKGGDSCGKSSTLNLVYDDLIVNGATVINPKIILGNSINRDFECLLEYLIHKIAFFTMGDEARPTISAIRKYDLLKIDFLILATNDKFTIPTIEILKHLNVIIPKTVAAPSTIANDLVANTSDCSIIVSHI